VRGGRAQLIDFDDPANNDFLVVRQLAIGGADGKAIRPDLVLYVNGLPLVVIELKDPANPHSFQPKGDGRLVYRGFFGNFA
jgi:type I restriction enzyme R subunit